MDKTAALVKKEGTAEGSMMTSVDRHKKRRRSKQGGPQTVGSNREITSSNSPSVWVRIAAGSVGSIMTALAVTPLDVIKVRLQAASSPITTVAANTQGASHTTCRSTFVLFNGHLDCIVAKSSVPYFQRDMCECLAPPRGAQQRLSILAAAAQILAREGPAGLYAGLTPTLVMAVPNTVLYYTAYDEITSRWTASSSPSTALLPLFAGASARLLASTLTSPLEYARTRQMALQKGGTLCQSQSLFKGLGSTLWRDVPFSAVYWLVLENLRSQWLHHDVSPDGFGRDFVCGALSGCLAATCTTPMDVVKTRIQAETDTRGTWTQLRSLWKNEGLRGLWRGNQARILKVAPGCAIMISTYEYGKVLLG